MAFTLVALVLFVASVSASPLGQGKCSWGPSYWCQNYKQALECNALEHCRTKVWTVKDQTACDICEQVVPKIKDFLAKNSTKTEVMTMAEQACEDIAGAFASMCKSIIDQYEPVIWSHVLELLSDPQQVCTALGLCNSMTNKKVDAKLIMSSLPMKTILAPVLVAVKPKLASIKSKHYTSGPECILCEYVMDKLDSILKENATQQEIEAALDKVCSLLPSTVSAECENFVKEYGPAVLAILAQELDPKLVCTALKLCTSDEHPKAMKRPVIFVPGSNETCTICTEVMTYLQDVLKDEDVRKEIISLLEDGCNQLPSSLASECNALVSQYGMAILELIAETDPKTLCTQFGLCSSSLKKAVKRPESNGLCEYCTTAMTFLKNLLNNATEEEIIQELEQLCNDLPTQLSSECNAIVSQYGKIILDMIKNADAKTLCTEIGLCSSALKTEGKYCFLGASYWCANRQNAISCNALKHCTDHVWN